MLDSGAPYYDVYECADRRYVAVGAIEDKFFAALVTKLELAGHPLVAKRLDKTSWPELRTLFAAAFARRTRDEWAAFFSGSDACVSPVLTMPEVAGHPQVVARGGMALDADRALPTPRFSDLVISL